MKKIIQNIFFNSKIIDYLIKRNNRKIIKQYDDRLFLRELCRDNEDCIDLDKYSKLMSMVKNKYKR